MKKVLITGSGGFVFSNFVRKALFNKSDYTFVSIDACRNPHILNNIYANKGHKFHIGDVADSHFINVIFELERPDIVIHGADNRHGESSELIRTNVCGTQNILEACSKWQVDRMIHVSSEEVYGSLETAEDSLVAPCTLYGATKAASELLVKTASVNYDILRLGHNYGQRQDLNNFVPSAIRSILSNKELVISGRSNQTRDWTYVEDTCSAIMTILHSPSQNQVYNISSGFEYSYLEVFQEICNVFERGHELIKFVEPASPQGDRKPLDISKLKTLGWKPNFKLKNGLFHTCSWYDKNSWFLRNKD